MQAARGRLIALEGIDGCGKSTQAALLAGSLDAVLTHEPGATDLGRAIRTIVLGHGGPDPVPPAEALLMLADRAQHVAEVIEPALAAGRDVVTDRYTGSTLAYQGAGRELGIEALEPVADWAAAGARPDVSVLLDLSVDAALARLDSGRADRLEALGPGFFERVRAGFLTQAASDPQRWVVVDGGKPPATVAQMVAEAVTERTGAP